MSARRLLVLAALLALPGHAIAAAHEEVDPRTPSLRWELGSDLTLDLRGEYRTRLGHLPAYPDDAEQRSKQGCIITLLVALFAWPWGILIWLVARPDDNKRLH